MNSFDKENLLFEINKMLDSSDHGLINKDSLRIKIKQSFASLNDDEVDDLIFLFDESNKRRNNEKVDLVVTAPHSYSIKASPTSIEMKKLLESAKSQILITGYSISEYFDDLIDVIISKLQKGVVVKLYLNDFEAKKEVLDKLLLYKGKFLQLYNYNKTSDGIDSLHAKVISVDMKFSLIGSANLSLNGLQKNIEVGTIIESTRIANNINEMFNTLVHKKVFIRQ